ncbi:FliM/FliN family flagellar motor C-terminal domain-containing protein [Sphingomonas colocasiae]|uniref:FliM/FliN family flagellar motor switch protein n=1 Tax=Sphingomonas colocasiae TaxID=1848973 RepID=A0ABS7PW24_9SPHN|nr:FliM/FliN family flagellar motor switch protein [Sphingomonas colocasiae]MBY8825565.1 FliM/FliN family flagellar motor switch protein [Sphingomonas colocasiae]
MTIAEKFLDQTAASARDVVRTAIDGLPVRVEAILGAASVKVGELSSLKPGDTLPLENLLGDPVSLRLNGKTIAYGELVSMGDNFAVRIQAIAQE